MLIRRKALAISLLMLTCFCLTVSQSNKDSSPDKLRRGNSAPVSSFFSELGDLLLDVDKTIAEQSRPKIEHEANVMSQLFRPGTDYFNRIQNNYKEMQKRLGRLIGNTIGFKTEYSEHELSTISPPPENFNPTVGPDYNPFAAAAEARKEKLKQRISKESFEPRSSIPKTIDESLKAFGKLSQAIIDDIGDFSRDGKPSKSAVKDSPKRAGDIEFEECGNEILEDPDLEQRRQDRCSRIAAENQARENLRKLMKEPKKVTEALFSKNIDALEKLSKSIERSGDVWTKDDSPVASSTDLEEECSNEVLEDPDLEKRRQDKCSNIAAEIRIMENLRNMMLDPKKATETLFSKNMDALDKLSKGIVGRSGDLFVESDQTSLTDEDSEALFHIKASTDECSGDVLEDASLEKIRREKCARIAAEERLINDLNKLLKDTTKESLKWIPVGSEGMNPSTFTKRSGDKDTSDDLSVSSIDKQIRQLIKDHGNWILDYPLFKSWRQRVRSSTDAKSSDQGSEETESYEATEDSTAEEIEPTEFYLPVSTDYEMAIQKSGDAVPDPHETSYYRIVNQDGDSMEEEVDFVLDPESLSNDIDEVGPKETVILAFTSDGVPLKLRLGPEVDNPIQYLHKVLQSAGVSINVPVEAYDDLEPVGKEVLKLGSGILTRAVLIDASNPNELKSFLKALMISKTTGKATF